MSEPATLTGQLTEQIGDAAQHAGERVHEVLEEVKPRLRGWLHAAVAPIAVAAGLVLVAVSPAGAGRLGAAVFATSASILFSVSATLHRGRWSRTTNLLLCRLDHASIFLLIAGTYTPFALLLLEGRAQTVVLAVAWAGALLGAAFRVLWLRAPRWLYTPAYIALGWTAVFFLDDFLDRGGAAVVALLVTGGLLYTIGGVVYGLRRPDPFPSWFGFHEVFHTLTVAAFAAHYAGVVMAGSIP